MSGAGVSVGPSPSSAETAKRRRIGRAVDLIGPAAFPITYFGTGDFVAATWATTAAAVAALAIRFALDRRLALLSLLSGIASVATGLLALVFGSRTVLEAKPTIVHGIAGIALLIAWGLDGRPARAALGRFVELPDRVWAVLCLRAAAYAFAMAIANEVIRRTAPTSVWALFHFPGEWLLDLGFVASQMPLVRRSRIRPVAHDRAGSGLHADQGGGG